MLVEIGKLIQQVINCHPILTNYTKKLPFHFAIFAEGKVSPSDV